MIQALLHRLTQDARAFQDVVIVVMVDHQVETQSEEDIEHAAQAKVESRNEIAQVEDLVRRDCTI